MLSSLRVCSLCLASMSWGVLSYSSVPKPERLQSLQPPTHSPLQNVDQINQAAAMFSLNNQSTLQVLKTDTVVSSTSQTWTVFSTPCCLLLFVWLCQFSNDKKLLSSRELRLLLSTFFFSNYQQACWVQKHTTIHWRCNINIFVTLLPEDLFYICCIYSFTKVSHYLPVGVGTAYYLGITFSNLDWIWPQSHLVWVPINHSELIPRITECMYTEEDPSTNTCSSIWKLALKVL